MGRAAGKFLGRFFWSGLGWKHTGIGLGWFLPRPKASRSKLASGKMLGLHFIGSGPTRRLKTGPGLDRKHTGCRLGRFLPNSKITRPTRIIPEMSPESASGELLGLHFTGGGSTRRLRTDPVGVGPVSLVPLGCSLRQMPSSSTAIGMAHFLSSSGGGSSGLQVIPVPSSRFPASTVFGFPPSPALDPDFPAVPAHSPAAIFKFIPLRPLQIPQPGFAPSSLAGAARLGEKLRASLPVVVSKPFQCHYRRAKELREWHSVKWNDELFSDSLEAMKMSAGCAVKKFTVAEPLVKKVTEPPVKQGLRRGFLNPRPMVPVIFTSPQKVVKVGMVGPSSPCPPREVAYLLFLLIPLKEMDFPNLEIGLLVLIIMGRLWFGRRTKIIRMVYPSIGLWMILLRRRPWLFGTPWRNIFAREDDSSPEVKRQEGATESAKLHKLWQNFSFL
jgi:hypothetical protein